MKTPQHYQYKPMRISKLAKKYGYKLIRQRKHLIWKHNTTGKLVTTALTPSDSRAIHNIERYFKKGALPA